MRQLTLGSLFSGIGGFELGFEWTGGFDLRWQVEIDPWCRKVLAKHWPTVPRYEDVREVGAHNLEPVDVIIGGFPCQDISMAGKGVGIHGERSGLWSEFHRTIRELRPRYAVMENVSALLHRGLDVVLGDLASSGYDAEWDCIPASALGAPHQRDRVWIVAYPQSKQGRYISAYPGNGRRGERGSQSGQSSTHAASLAYATSFHAQGLHSRQGPAQPGGSSRWATEPDVGRVANGVPRRVDRLRGLGNAVVPQVAQYVAECVLSHYRSTEEAA